MTKETIIIACIVVVFGLAAFGFFAMRAHHATSSYATSLNNALNDDDSQSNTKSSK